MTTATWVGITSGYGNLDDPANWSTGVVPGKGDTAVFGTNISVDTLDLGKGRFAASTVDINPGMYVGFYGSGADGGQPAEYDIQTLNIGQGAVAQFSSDSSLVAQTVNNAGWLNMLHATVLGANMPNPFAPSLAFSNPLINGEIWSFLHGFGWTDLSGVVGTMNLLPDSAYLGNPNLGVEGSITTNFNLAVEDVVPTYLVTTDQYNYMRQGSNVPYNSTAGLVDVASGATAYNQPGYASPTAYTMLFNSKFG